MPKFEAQMAAKRFEKTALRRAGKEILRLAERELPGFTKKYYSQLAKKYSIERALKEEIRKLPHTQDTIDRVDRIIGKDPTYFQTLLAAAQPADVAFARAMKAPRRSALLPPVTTGVFSGFSRPFLTSDPKILFSGRHAPRPNEFTIPAAASPEFMVNPQRPRSSFLFRGNPIPEEFDFESPAYLTTRHPDVAAGYAVGSTFAVTPASNRLYIIRRKGLKGIETAADQYGVAPDRHGDLKRLKRPADLLAVPTTRFTSSQRDILGRTNPTYETVVSARHRPKPVAEFLVRESRSPTGQPLYALRSVSGELPEKLLKQIFEGGAENV